MEKKGYIPPMHIGSLTPLYDLGCALIGLGRRFRSVVIERLGITGTERVLDAGCGTGTLLIMLKGRYPSVLAEGLDPDERALEIAEKKSDRKGLEIRWHAGVMEKMPFEDGSFDIVVSTLALHHVYPDNKHQALRECLRVLKPDGRMVMVDIAPDETGFIGRIIYRLLSMFEHLSRSGEIIAMMKEAGFSDVRETGGYPYGISFIEGRKTILR